MKKIIKKKLFSTVNSSGKS